MQMHHKKWTEEEEDNFVELFLSGKTIEEISIEIGRTVVSVDDKINQLKLPTLGRIRKELKKYNLKICGGCKKTFEISETFTRRSKCRECEKNRYYNRRRTHDINIYFSSKISSLKTGAKKRNLEFNITKEELINKYNSQKGLCYYTGVKMAFFDSEKILTISHDRINPDIGYVNENVVLCCHIVNIMKTDLQLQEFIEICKIILDNRK